MQPNAGILAGETSRAEEKLQTRQMVIDGDRSGFYKLLFNSLTFILRTGREAASCCDATAGSSHVSRGRCPTFDPRPVLTNQDGHGSLPV